MGIQQHETLIITTYDKSICEELVSKLSNENKYCLSDYHVSPVNGYVSLTIYTIGSKLGWKEDKFHKNNIYQIIKTIKTFDFDDGSNPFDFVHLSYGDWGAEIERTNCENKY